MNKKINYKKIRFTILFSFFSFLIPLVFIYASTVTYTPLEPNAFALVNTSTSNNPLIALLTNAYTFGIAAAVVLALIMVIWGGIIKMTTDSWQGQDEAKTKFTDAAYGLGLALVSYLILYTINPCLVKFTDQSTCNNQFLFPTTTTTGTTTTSSTGVLSDSAARTQLTNAGIAVSSTGNCSDQTNSSCTSLEGLPQFAVTQLLATQKTCQSLGCSLTVTGGTETGHKSHGSGIATVDLKYSSSVRSSLVANGLTETSSFVGSSVRSVFFCETTDGDYINCGSSDVGHVHVQY